MLTPLAKISRSRLHPLSHCDHADCFVHCCGHFSKFFIKFDLFALIFNVLTKREQNQVATAFGTSLTSTC